MHGDDAGPEIVEDPIRFASGGTELSGTLFRPVGPPVAAAVLNSATGVPHAYYRHFARWLARTRGIACLTWDYSGFGTSARGPLRACDRTMSDWALSDQPAARAEMRRRLPGVPLWVIGHSLGAMMMPLQDGIDDIARMIGVTSGLVRHTDHPWPYQAMARAFWFGHVPVLVRLAGYLPGRLTGFGADLPAGVYWQWRRWCTGPNSFLPETGMALPLPDWNRSAAPVTLLALADDAVVPARCVWRLAPLYGSEVRKVLIDPKEHGLGTVGHLGLFRPENAALWPVVLDAA